MCNSMCKYDLCVRWLHYFRTKQQLISVCTQDAYRVHHNRLYGRKCGAFFEPDTKACAQTVVCIQAVACAQTVACAHPVACIQAVVCILTVVCVQASRCGYVMSCFLLPCVINLWTYRAGVLLHHSCVLRLSILRMCM